jgi:hypothetical protein
VSLSRTDGESIRRVRPILVTEQLAGHTVEKVKPGASRADYDFVLALRPIVDIVKLIAGRLARVGACEEDRAATNWSISPPIDRQAFALDQMKAAPAPGGVSAGAAGVYLGGKIHGANYGGPYSFLRPFRNVWCPRVLPFAETGR